jgi:peptidyl-prolyl cis-trans isomerase D
MEVSPGVLVSARVVQHHPEKRRPLEEVKDEIRARVIAAEASRLAREEGEKLLASLKGDGKADLEKFGAETTVSRASPGDFPPQAIEAIFKLPTQPLPAFGGVDLGPRGFYLVKLEKAGGPDPAAEERRQAYRQQVEQVLSQTSVAAYLEEVKSRLSIERKLQQ